MTIPYGRQCIDESDIDAVVEVLRGDWLTQGPAVSGFEDSFARACSAQFAVAFSSGTAALHGAAFAAGVQPGDELLTSAITFSASANCGAYLGATPRFADIDPATWNVSAATVRAAITSATKAIVPVHFTGLPAPIAEIRAAAPDGVAIIEDAAQALGAHRDGEPVGSCRHSDMAVFSLHPVKSITSAEGGMVTTNDDRLRERLQMFRNHGLVLTGAADAAEGGWYREQHALGFNYRLSDVHAALGASQLTKLESFIERRNRVAQRYREWLGDVEELVLCPEAPAGSKHAYHLFIVWHREGSTGRRRLYDGLRERGINAQVHFIPVYWHPYYRAQHGYERGMCPDAEGYYDGCLSLPCFPGLTEEQQRTVVDAVRDVLNA